MRFDRTIFLLDQTTQFRGRPDGDLDLSLDVLDFAAERQRGSVHERTQPYRASTVEAFIILLGPLGGSNMDVRTNERLKNFLIIHGYFSTMSEIVTEEPPEPKSCKTYDRRSRRCSFAVFFGVPLRRLSEANFSSINGVDPVESQQQPAAMAIPASVIDFLDRTCPKRPRSYDHHTIHDNVIGGLNLERVAIFHRCGRHRPDDMNRYESPTSNQNSRRTCRTAKRYDGQAKCHHGC